MKKTLLPFALLVLFASQIFAQEKYAEVAVKAASPEQLQTLTTAGFDTDHVHWSPSGDVVLTLSQSEVSRLENLGYEHEILVEDLTAHFLKQQAETAHLRTNMDCGLTHFDEGEMGGYHSYADVTDHLNTMLAEFPDIVSLSQIGTSIEGREIWAVKISDNVATDESATEGVVYFDALHHAREPMSMESQLYFMWWLLENYGTDEMATYLVDHREMHFVPVVNPDGYVYNQTTNPDGGGFWRKNRRDSGGGCFGVDLNRNYSYGYGDPTGSSSDPCSGIYRGEEPFSEPESVAVRDYVLSIGPAIGFTMHTYGQTFLSPFGYTDTLVDYHIYAEFSSEFTPRDYRGYGTTAKMLGYTSSGTTRDWLHSEGTFGWTPEIGTEFWEPSANICGFVQEFFEPMRYLCMVAGQYSVLQDFTLENPGGIWTGDEVLLTVRLKNRGLSHPAENVTATLRPLHAALSPAEATVDLGTIPARGFAESAASPLFEITGMVEVLERLPIEITVKQDGDFSHRDTIYLTAGHTSVIYETDCEDADDWLSWGDGTAWDTSFMDMRSGFHSFADSRYGNYLANSDIVVEPLTTFDLSETENPQLEFWAKWSLQPNSDYAQLQRVDGTGWDPVATDFTENTGVGPAYHRNYHWVQEQVDLSDWKDQDFQFRFRLTSGNNVHSDGFYLDNLRIVDYFEPPSAAGDLPLANVGVSVFPNPSDGDFRLRVFSEKTSYATLSVQNILGEMVDFQQVTLLAGEHVFPFSLPAAKAGVYLVEVRTEQGTKALRLVVR